MLLFCPCRPKEELHIVYIAQLNFEKREFHNCLIDTENREENVTNDKESILP